MPMTAPPGRDPGEGSLPVRAPCRPPAPAPDSRIEMTGSSGFR
ncbi:hypothetical protein GA0115242_10898 [Streptomyces sp. SolWspMP-5a-2]|nr:hypothetical protein GA0115242_10898 [Streptomyces sp. SolWspMP-5a-2]